MNVENNHLKSAKFVKISTQLICGIIVFDHRTKQNVTICKWTIFKNFWIVLFGKCNYRFD